MKDIDMDWAMKKGFILLLALGGMVSATITFKACIASDREATRLNIEHPEFKVQENAIFLRRKQAECTERVKRLNGDETQIVCDPGATAEIQGAFFICHCPKSNP